MDNEQFTEEEIKEWQEGPSRQRIRGLVDVVHMLVESSINQGMTFAELMTCLDILSIEIAMRLEIEPPLFEKGHANLCERYERVFLERKNETS